MLNTLAQYKQYLKITDTSLDDWLTDQITEIEDGIRICLGRSLETATFTEVYNGDGSNELVLNQFPVTSITNVYYMDEDAETWTEYVDETDYDRLVIDYSKLIMVGGVFYEGVGNIKVIYVAGYSTIPGTIKKAAKELLTLAYKNCPAYDGRLGLLSKNKSAGVSASDVFDPNAEKKIFDKIRFYRSINV